MEVTYPVADTTSGCPGPRRETDVRIPQGLTAVPPHSGGPAGTPTLLTAHGQLGGGGFQKAGPLRQGGTHTEVQLTAQAQAELQLKPHDPSPSPSAPLTSLGVSAESSSCISTPVSGSALGSLPRAGSGKDTEGGLVSPVCLGPSLSGAPHFAGLVSSSPYLF